MCATPPVASTMDSVALMYGLRAWARQVQTHAGFYKWWLAMKKELNPRKEKQIADLLEEAGPVGNDAARAALPIADFIGHELVLAIPAGGSLSSKVARKLLSNKRRLKSEEGLAAKIGESAEALASAGIIDIAEAESGKRGRRLFEVRKRSWLQIRETEGALAVVERLLLTAEDFEGH